MGGEADPEQGRRPRTRIDEPALDLETSRAAHPSPARDQLGQARFRFRLARLTRKREADIPRKEQLPTLVLGKGQQVRQVDRIVDGVGNFLNPGAGQVIPHADEESRGAGRVEARKPPLQPHR